MGCNKAVVHFLGEPLIMRSIDRLSFLTDDLSITTNDPESLSFLSTEKGRDDIRLVTDAADERGALYGMLTAFQAATLPYVAIVACDMIFPSAPLIRHEYEIVRDGGYDLAIPRQTKGWEPFHAVYRRETCLGAVRSAIASGERRAHGWFRDMNLYALTRDEVLATDPRGGTFINANTPEELERIEQRILEGRMTFKDVWPEEDA